MALKAQILKDREEVYTGFHELDGLLPAADAAAVAVATLEEQQADASPLTRDSDASLPAQDRRLALLMSAAAHMLQGTAYNHPNHEIPKELRDALGIEATQELWEFATEAVGVVTDGRQWWWDALPQFVRWLCQDRNDFRVRRIETLDALVAVQQRSLERSHVREEAAEAAAKEIEEKMWGLHKQLELSKAR